MSTLKNLVFCVVIMLSNLLGILLLLGSCSEPDSQNSEWLPSLENFESLPHKEQYVITDNTGSCEFEVTVATEDKNLLNQVDQTNFSLEILPVEDEEIDYNREGAGIVIDEEQLDHGYNSLNDSEDYAPPPLFIKVHALTEEEPARFKVNLHNFGTIPFSMVVNAGHYQSIVLRRSGSGSSYVKFYHHHGDWNLHVLYQGYFSKCTYAYDCYAGHSIPSWWTSKGDESIEYRVDCYGRCP